MKVWVEFLFFILGERGKLATLQGLFLAVPVNIIAVYRYFLDYDFTSGDVTIFIVFNSVSVIWVVLPKSIKLSFGKVKINVED